VRGLGLSTPFLLGFTRAIFRELLSEQLIEVQVGSEDLVIAYVADFLRDVPEGNSLISSLARGFIMCPYVDELYADNDQLKLMVQGLESAALSWTGE
jgi:hypothetical protein